MINWNEILSILISSVTIVAILGYLGKKIIEGYSSKVIERHKSDLDKETERHKSELNKDVEAFKSKLSLLSEEFKVTFPILHQKRSEVMNKFYAHVVEIQENLVAYVKLMDNQEKLIEIVNNQQTSEAEGKETQNPSEDWKKNMMRLLVSLTRFFKYNRIYFSKISSTLIDDYLLNINNIIMDVTESEDKSTNTKNKFIESIENSTYPLKEKLENEFRNILGVK